MGAGSSGGARSGDGAGAGGLEDGDRDAYWLEIWAYGTSPYGLGLDEETLWSLTPREFEALKRQHERSHVPAMWMHAAIQATLHNAHFRGENQPAFQASQFMPPEFRPAPAIPKPGEEPWRKIMAAIRPKLEMQLERFKAQEARKRRGHE